MDGVLHLAPRLSEQRRERRSLRTKKGEWKRPHKDAQTVTKNAQTVIYTYYNKKFIKEIS